MSVTGPTAGIEAIARLSEAEIENAVPPAASWHNQYKTSCYVAVTGIVAKLTEGDLRIVFSQVGEPIDINLLRHKDSGLSKGIAFVGFADQRSTALAVDNFNGYILLGRRLKVDHCLEYRPPQKRQREQEEPLPPRRRQ